MSEGRFYRRLLRHWKKKGVDLYCWDRDDLELQRRLNVCWINVSQNKGERRYEPMNMDRQGWPENSWAIWDMNSGCKRPLTRAEVLALGYAQCCEVRDGVEVVMQ